MNNATALPDAVRTLIEVLSEAGYRAAGFVAVRHFAAAMNWRGFDDLPDVEGVATAR